MVSASGCRRVEEGNCIRVVTCNEGLRILRMRWRRRVEGGGELVSQFSEYS